jgi:hypothetical protein
MPAAGRLVHNLLLFSPNNPPAPCLLLSHPCLCRRKSAALVSIHHQEGLFLWAAREPSLGAGEGLGEGVCERDLQRDFIRFVRTGTP